MNIRSTYVCHINAHHVCSTCDEAEAADREAGTGAGASDDRGRDDRGARGGQPGAQARVGGERSQVHGARLELALHRAARRLALRLQGSEARQTGALALADPLLHMPPSPLENCVYVLYSYDLNVSSLP